jgi:ribose transport system permease protein
MDGIMKRGVNSNYFVLIVVFVVMCAVFGYLRPNFLSGRNALNILTSGSLVGLIAIAESYLIISGMIDLSVGGIAAFSGVFAAILAQNGWSLPMIILTTLLVGMLFGLVNGILVTKIQLQPFIATLATMSIARGLGFIICNVKPVRVANSAFNAIGTLKILSISLPVVILIVLFIVFGVILNRTTFGRKVYMIGGNANAARLAGINVAMVKIKLFIISSGLAALGGIILAARMTSGQPTAASDVDFDAITAVVLGGIAMTGGTGTMIGTFIGLMVMLTLNNGLLILGVTTYWQNVAKGLVLIFALTLDHYRTKRSKRVTVSSTPQGVINK